MPHGRRRIFKSPNPWPTFSDTVKEFNERNDVTIEDIEKEIAKSHPHIEETNRNSIVFKTLQLGGFYKK